MNNQERSIHNHKRYRRHNETWFLLFVLLLGLGTLFGLSRLDIAVAIQTSSAQSGSAPVPGVTSSTPAPIPPATIRVAQRHLYRFPSSNVGLMQPSVDAHGNVWVGEMYANHLARLDSRTGAVMTLTPPHAQNGIMSTTIDTSGNVWFVEEAANYIGRFDPAQHILHIFSLGTVGGRPLGPQDLQFDAAGFLWFTALSDGRIGRLDPATGKVKTWPIPSPAAGIPATPFSLTVTADGQIWFGDLTGGAVGHLDPATGRVTLYDLADPQAEVFSIAADARGRLWFTEIVPGKLGMIDPVTGKVTEWPVPTLAGHPATLYELVVTKNGTVWFVDNGADALVRYEPDKSAYTFFQLNLPSSAPYGLTLDSAGLLWFTAASTSTNYVGEMAT